MDKKNLQETVDIRKEKRKKILTDTTIISNNVILPALMIISKSILIIVLFCALLFINYSATLILILILILIYICIFYFSNKKVKENIKRIEWLKEEKSILINDILTGKSPFNNQKKVIVKQYFTYTYELSKHQSFNNVIAKLPRYLMMFLVFTFIIFLSLYLVYANQGDMSTIMHKMLLFIIIGLKLLPQIQNIFINYLKLKSNINSFINMKEDLFKASI